MTSIPASALLPAASAHNRLQAYEDAIRYRQIRLIAADCADCGEIRCADHKTDEQLIGQYQAHMRQLGETMAAEREASLARARRELGGCG